MIALVDPVNAGFALADTSDPRHRYITTLRRRFGWFLHNASLSLLKQGEENTVDAVNALVSRTARPPFVLHITMLSRYGRSGYTCLNMAIAETGSYARCHPFWFIPTCFAVTI